MNKGYNYLLGIISIVLIIFIVSTFFIDRVEKSPKDNKIIGKANGNDRIKNPYVPEEEMSLCISGLKCQENMDCRLNEYCINGCCEEVMKVGFSHIIQGNVIRWDVASENSDYVMIATHINWTQYLNGWEEDSMFEFYKYLSNEARENDLGVYISIDPTPDRIELDSQIPELWGERSFENENVSDALLSFTERVMNEIGPDYLSIGMEINSYYASNPDDFVYFMVVYNEAYNLVKSIHDIPIGPTLQYEQLSGNLPGSFETQYEILSYFENSDFLGLTTYPRVNFISVSEIPSNYYTKIRQHSSKPIVFAESGWPSDFTADDSEKKQSEYLSFLIQSADELGTDLLIWWFLYDADYPEDFFDSMGLLEINGKEKEAWEIWREYFVGY